MLLEQGDVDAQFNLGLIYYNEYGVKPDYKVAMEIQIRIDGAWE